MATGKVAVVTGGSAGVGRATAELLARRGYDVAVMARGGAGLAGAVEDIERQGRRGLGLDVDVSDDKAVQEAAAAVRSSSARSTRGSTTPSLAPSPSPGTPRSKSSAG